ncbi:MAG: glycosyltransferase family 9 protein, partial [Deltaproteobacteria bacterium]|nr:glycosyltransferase family 9 protein [Deltaproteobacteria bacterium]
RTRFLVVRPGALGDTILALPLLSSVQGQHPDSVVTLLGNRAYQELLPPGIEFCAIDDPSQLWIFSGENVELDPTIPVYERAYVILERPADVIRNLRRARIESIRHVGSRPPAGTHVVKHLHCGLGLPVPSPAPALKHLAPSEKKDLIWIHPGSGGRKKCLPLELMAFLSESLTTKTGWDLAITLGEADEFLKKLPGWKRLVQTHVQLFENRPLKEICRELGRAKLFVGNDSGMAHLAAGLGIRGTVFYVSTDPVQWAPWVREGEVRVMDLRGRQASRPELEQEVLAAINQDPN